MYGRPSSESDPLSGGDMAYVYPDFKTVLRGEFRDGVMVAGRETKITGFRWITTM